MLPDFELKILRFFRSISTSFTDFLMECITILGEQLVIVVILAVVYFVYDKRAGKKLAYIIFTSTNLNAAVKGVVARSRPFVVDPTLNAARIETATGHSFPSGHTQSSSTIFYSLAIEFKKKWVWIVCVILTLLIGFSRIVLGVHFPTDVICGMALGIACAFGLSYIYDKFAINFKSELILYVVSLIIFIPFLFIFYRKNFIDIEIYENFYKAFAMNLGFIFAYILDEKFINFNNNAPLKTRLLRVLGAGITYAVVNFGLKMIFPDNNIYFIIVRYFMITFGCLGLYPLIFKKILFKEIY